MTELADKLKELKTIDPAAYGRLAEILRSALATNNGSSR